MSPPNRRLTEPEKEGLRLYFESAKHLTTLNAGSIVLIATFLKDIFPSEGGSLTVGPWMKFLIGAAIVSFGISLLISVIDMSLIIGSVENQQALVETRSIETLVVVAPLVIFVLAVFLFGFAVVLNL
jgi:hypothetical protein